MDVLVVDADRLIIAAVTCWQPPLVAVAGGEGAGCNHGLAWLGVRLVGSGCSSYPVSGHDLFAHPVAFAAEQFPELREVVRRKHQPTCSHLGTRSVGDPVALGSEPQWIDELFLHVVGDRPADGAGEHHAKGLGIGGVVATERARSVLVLHAANKLTERQMTGHGCAEAVDVGFGVGVVLVDRDADEGRDEALGD